MFVLNRIIRHFAHFPFIADAASDISNFKQISFYRVIQKFIEVNEMTLNYLNELMFFEENTFLWALPGRPVIYS